MSVENALEVADLTKRVDSILAVDNVTFEVEKGQIFGFLGPNGAGKTTTIRLLAGLTRPTSGTTSVAGRNVVEERALFKFVNR